MDQLEWELLLSEDLDGYTKEMRNIYNRAIREISREAEGITPTEGTIFRFSSYPLLNKKVNEILADLSARAIKLITGGIKEQWLKSNQKNDELVKRILPTTKLTEEQLSKYMSRNLEALAAFQNQKLAGLKLSERVYKQGEQFRQELEMALDIGLGLGKSADALSRDIRGYLEEPDKLFRRVRDKHGALQLSKNAKAYNPGRGVYRSSYKNAQRLTRTQINMGYREADFERWATLDFVVGYEIKRSNNPYPCVLCDSMVGKYPKTFKWRGNHPNCRCYMVSIMATQAEMDKLIDNMINEIMNDNFKSVNEVTQLPAGHVAWVKENKERLLRAKQQPFFIQDNYKGGSVTGGWKLG